MRGVLLGLGCLAWAGAALVQDALTGRALFLQYCATCHGEAAEGNGPMAPVLLVQPKDLTALAAENGGAFPAARVVARIDGREALVSHGSSMPIYAEVMAGELVAMEIGGATLTISRRIADLVAYLMEIQK
jgi:mono/diheme cytochrome c family protein